MLAIAMSDVEHPEQYDTLGAEMGESRQIAR